MRTFIKEAVEQAYNKLVEKSVLPLSDIASDHIISVPKLERHGDYASNFAMVMASSLRMPPRKIAGFIQAELSDSRIFQKIEVAGPGFLNFFISPSFWQRNLLAIKREGSEYGRSRAGEGRKVLVEFVSANPTGPLHQLISESDNLSGIPGNPV